MQILGYDCYAVDETTHVATHVAKGVLKDVSGEQAMTFFESFKTPCKKLLCRFTMAENQTKFKILDMKVDCKPF